MFFPLEPADVTLCLYFFSLPGRVRFFDAVYTKFYPPQRSRPQNSHQISLHTSKYFLGAVKARWLSTTTSGLPMLPLTPRCVHDFYKMLCVLCLCVCLLAGSSLAQSLSSMQSRPLTEIICHFLTPQRFLVLSCGWTSTSCVTEMSQLTPEYLFPVISTPHKQLLRFPACALLH